MGKKLLSILLTIAMLLCMLPAGYAEEIEIVDEPGIMLPDDDAVMIDGAEIRVNPLYREQISAEEVAVSLREAAETEAASYSCASIEEAAAALREGMKARETNITIRYTGSESFDYWDVLDLAMAHTGNPTEGDYLSFQYGGCRISYGSGSYSYQLTYYTTAEQEAEMDAAVASTLNQLALGGKTEYQKIRAVYDFVCANTVYDYDHLGNSSYKLQFTAYAALINKTSVCQGYANLLYRLLLSVGVDTRIVTSETHAWNIVRIGDWYYNVDSTWDAGYNGNYSWFLKCMDHFTGEDHVREAPYSEEPFLTDYPMSPTDYSVGDNPITLEKEELTLYLGGDPATVRFTIDPTYDFSYVSFSYTGGGLFSVSGSYSSVTVTPLKAGGGVVNVLLKDEDGNTLAKATIYVTVLEAAPAGYTVTVTDYTKGAATLDGIEDGALCSGEVTFAVTCDKAALVAVRTADGYTLLPCTTVGEEHRFTLTVAEDTEIAVAFKGDTNLNGTLEMRDATLVSQVKSGAYTNGGGLSKYTADINGNGKVETRDATLICQARNGAYVAQW